MKAITLLVDFDVDQIAVKLSWDTSPDSTPLTGPHSGSLLLPQGAPFRLKVKGVGDAIQSELNPNPLSKFTIKECCFVTQPMVLHHGQAPFKTIFTQPSPFLDCTTACVPLKPVFSSSSVSDANRITVIETWDSHLTVGSNQGRWMSFFFVTLDIFREGQSMPERRVFNFDCEIEVGGTPK